MKTIQARVSWSLAASALVTAVIVSSLLPAASAATEEESENPGLKDVYEDHFLIGSVINPNDWVANDGNKWEHMLKHYNAVTPENHTKPDMIWGGDSSTGYPADEPTGLETADEVLTRANDAGFYTIGHALAWHNQSRYWPARSADRNTMDGDMTIHWDYEEARSELQHYIETIAGRYSDGPHELDEWDVVNEAMRDNPENPTDWRNAMRSMEQPRFRAAAWAGAYADGGNAWEYVYDAFVFAREAAPDAVLYYNDFNDLEEPNKAIAIASMVTDLNAKYAQEYPEDDEKLIQGIGIQGHYNTRLDIDNLERVLQIYIETGAEISITELDMSIPGTQDTGSTTPPSEEQLREQADKYAELFLLLKRYSDHIERVSFWGTSDSNSWRGDYYPLPFSRSGNTWSEKDAYYAIIDPEGWLGFDKERPELASFTYRDEVFNFESERTEYDVHVPADTSGVDFSAEDIVHGFGEELDVEVSLEPSDCAVSPGNPCVATVEAAWASEPSNAATYTINFGHMSAEWENDVNYPDTGYRSAVNVRFSDGSSDIKLFHEFLSDGDAPAFVTSADYPAPPKHQNERYTVSTDTQVEGSDLEEMILRKHVWDHNWVPLTDARITDLSIPESTWQPAESIEDFKTYLVVADEHDQALTHEGLDPVPAGEGISEERQGYYGTPVVVEDDTVVEPEMVQDNTRWLFTETESSDPGPYTEANGYTGFTMRSLVHGGLIQPFIMHRENHPDRVNTDGLRSDRLVGNDNLDRAVWFNTGLDENGETTLFTHTADTSETYALHGSSAGFAAEGGTGELSEYAEFSRVTLYEYVTDKTFEEANSLGIGIEFGSVERVVGEPDIHYEIPVTADVQDGRQALLLKDGATVATGAFENGEATLQVNESDVEPDANYVIVALDDTDVLGATPLPADAFVVPVEDPVDLVVTPGAPTIGVDGAVQLEATAVYDDGSEQSVTDEADWASDDADVAAVDEAGLVTGVAEGSAEVTATFEDLSDSSTVTVDPEVAPGPVGLERISAEPGRVEVAIAASHHRFDDGEASAVVLARADEYPDALAGTTLAAEHDAPLLLTSSDELLDNVADEIARVLGDDGAVYLTGGTEALDETVEDAVEGLEYESPRLGGATRFETAGVIADALGDRSQVLVTTGLDFPDALTAGAAAAAHDGVVLLSADDDAHEVVDDYLGAFDGDVTAVGGPATRAYPDAQAVMGETRDETAVAVAEAFFDEPVAFGISRRDDYPDALSGGAHIAAYGGPLLLSYTDDVPDETADWLQATEATGGFVYGGTHAISEDAFDELDELAFGNDDDDNDNGEDNEDS